MSIASSPLSFREKLGYGLGDTASHFVWDMVGFWILIFYTDTVGISAAAAGTIMLMARIWDMASDPLMGIIADRTRTRWGKFRPYLLWGALPYAVLAVMAFSSPDLGPTGKAVYAAVTYMLLSAASFAVMSAMVKLAGELPLHEKVLARNLVTLVITAALFLRRGENPLGPVDHLGLLLTRSLVGLLGVACYFYAIQHLYLAGQRDMARYARPANAAAIVYGD